MRIGCPSYTIHYYTKNMYSAYSNIGTSILAMYSNCILYDDVSFFP